MQKSEIENISVKNNKAGLQSGSKHQPCRVSQNARQSEDTMYHRKPKIEKSTKRGSLNTANFLRGISNQQLHKICTLISLHSQPKTSSLLRQRAAQ
jgi:hypothetical protein